MLWYVLVLDGPGARTGRKSRLTSKTCQAATSSGLTDEKTGARGEGGAASSRTVVAAASASAVSIADVIEHEPTDHNGECTREHKRGVVAASSSADVQIGFESPLENAQGAPNAAEGEEGGSMYGNFESGAAAPGLWEGDTGAPWTEFEDWLLQDTFSRCLNSYPASRGEVYTTSYTRVAAIFTSRTDTREYVDRLILSLRCPRLRQLGKSTVTPSVTHTMVHVR